MTRFNFLTPTVESGEQTATDSKAIKRRIALVVTFLTILSVVSAVETIRAHSVIVANAQRQPSQPKPTKATTRSSDGIQETTLSVSSPGTAATVRAQELNELAERLPEESWLTSIEADSQIVLISGEAARYSVVADAIRALKRSPYFRDVNMTEASRLRSIARVTFRLRLISRFS